MRWGLVRREFVEAGFVETEFIEMGFGEAGFVTSIAKRRRGPTIPTCIVRINR